MRDRLEIEVQKILESGKEYRGSPLKDCFRLFELYRLGLSCSEISERIGRPTRWVVRRLAVLKYLVRLPFTKLEKLVGEKP